MGVGIHGEPGRRRVPLASADRIAEEMVGAIAGDFGEAIRGNALLLINGFGGTPLMELYLMYNSARKEIERRGARVVRSLVGNFVTSLDMAGCSVTVAMLDEDLTGLWDAPVETPAFAVGPLTNIRSWRNLRVQPTPAFWCSPPVPGLIGKDSNGSSCRVRHAVLQRPLCAQSRFSPPGV